MTVKIREKKITGFFWYRPYLLIESDEIWYGGFSEHSIEVILSRTGERQIFGIAGYLSISNYLELICKKITMVACINIF